MLINAVVSICLAEFGFGYMSLAWASLVSGTAGLLLYLFLCPQFSIFRPSLSEWRSVVGFGSYACVTALLYRAWEVVPYLIFGRILNTESVGLYQRAVTVCKLPENVLLASVWTVALPALAQKQRDGHGLTGSYLLGLEYVTVLLWPALLVLVLLAHPLVFILLGQKWLGIVPLVQIIACASLFAFPSQLTNPTLVAVGAMRQRLVLTVCLATLSVGAQAVAAFYGLRAVAYVMFLTAPISALAAILVVRVFVPFGWGELAKSLHRSAIVALLSAIGPLAVVLMSGGSEEVTIGGAVVALFLAGIGWLGGLVLSDHPFWGEMRASRDVFLNSPLVAGAADATRRFWQ
jgi:O-antigen/teichoic acid export membrane protein